MKNIPESGVNNCCGGSDSTGTSGMGRREFIKASGLTAGMLLAGRMNVMAGPFSAADFDKIIPADKKLSKEWIAGLYARGEALTATGEDLYAHWYAHLWNLHRAKSIWRATAGFGIGT